MFRDCADQAAALVSPVWCTGCLAEDVVLCDLCAAALRRALRQPFRAEAAALALPIIGESGTAAGMRVLPVMAAGRYQGLVSRAVLGFKDHERIGLSRVLAPALYRAVQAACTQLPGEGLRAAPAPGEILLLRPPTGLRSRLRRSIEPVEYLLTASGLSTEPGLITGGPGPAGLLRTSAQKSRTLDARRRAVRGMWQPTARGHQVLSGAPVVLVDDVLTTGATLSALYAAASEAGARVLGAAVLAAAPRAVSEQARRF